MKRRCCTGGKTGVAVTTYESISRFNFPEKFRGSMVVADEAHYVKNPDTQRTKALRGQMNRCFLQEDV